jgi:hypothetical protein
MIDWRSIKDDKGYEQEGYILVYNGLFSVIPPRMVEFYIKEYGITHWAKLEPPEEVNMLDGLKDRKEGQR